MNSYHLQNVDISFLSLNILLSQSAIQTQYCSNIIVIVDTFPQNPIQTIIGAGFLHYLDLYSLACLLLSVCEPRLPMVASFFGESNISRQHRFWNAPLRSSVSLVFLPSLSGLSPHFSFPSRRAVINVQPSTLLVILGKVQQP